MISFFLMEGKAQIQRGELAHLRSIRESGTPRTPRTLVARLSHRHGHESDAHEIESEGRPTSGV